jgi:hypothetical protein
MIVLGSFVALLLSPTVVLAQASPAPAAESPGPAISAEPTAPASAAADFTTVDPTIAARAKDWFHRAQTATIDRTQLDDKMNAVLTDAAAKQFAAQIAPLGDATAFVFIAGRKFAGNTAYKFRVTFKTASFLWLFVLNDAGKISGLRLAPDEQK